MHKQIKRRYRMTAFCLMNIAIILMGSARSSSAQNSGQNRKRFPVPAIRFSPKNYVVYKTNVPITIDGKLNEDIWKQVKWTDDFVDARRNSGPAPKYETRVKLLWDNQYLYVGATLQDDNLWGNMTKRDTLLYLDNAFEIFIDPDKDTHNYAELEINALGTLWDLFLSAPYRDKPQVLNDYNLLNARSAVHLNGKINEPTPKDKGWSLEYAIPLTSLIALDSEHQSLAGGAQWKVNFQRAQRRLKVVDNAYQLKKDPATGQPYPPDFWVWSPQGINNIHYPEMWGVIQFSEATAGQRTDRFKPDAGQQYRWILRQVYYKMKEYQLNHGTFTEDINRLNLDKMKALDEDRIDIDIETTPSLFEATLSIASKEGTWHINQAGRVWKN